MTASNDYDVLVTGGGVVGLAISALLARAGYSIALCDPRDTPAELTEDFDIKTYALTPASMRMLEKLNVAAKLDEARIAPIQGMHVWDAASDGYLEFDAAALGRPRLGSIVEHSNLIGGLDAVVSAYDTITHITARLETFTQSTDVVQAVLDSGQCVRAQLLVACDGAHSVVRKLLALTGNIRDYDQQAVICNVEVEHAHNNIARQRFLPTGPLAFLPLPQPHSCAVVWSTDYALAADALNVTDDEFNHSLVMAFERTLGEVRAISARHAVPLRTVHIDAYSVERVVLLGDAAHIVHPLAGQGLNLGLMDAAALAEAIGPHAEHSLRFPRGALRRYERARRGENMAMLKFTDLLNRLFQRDSRVLTQLRGSGMGAINRLTPVKDWLMLRAMGDIGDVPDIAAFP